MSEKKKLPRLKKRLATLNEETKKQKEALLVQLTKYPIVEVACNKTGVGRSTYYDWRQKDKQFCQMADRAISLGVDLITDMAESGLIKNIQANSNTAIIFWLKNHHGGYSDRIRHTHELEMPIKIPEEQVDQINFALHNIGMGSIIKMNREAQERLEKNIIKKEQRQMNNEEKIIRGIAKEEPEWKTKTEEDFEKIEIKVGKRQGVNLKEFFAKYDKRREEARKRLDRK